MKPLAKLAILPFLYCLTLPNLGSLNHLLQTANDTTATHITNERIVSTDDGYVLFFNSPIAQTPIQLWLDANEPSASACPAN